MARLIYQSRRGSETGRYNLTQFHLVIIILVAIDWDYDGDLTKINSSLGFGLNPHE